MSQLKVRFGEVHHGWVKVTLWNNDVEISKFEASYIYSASFRSLVNVLLAMLDLRAEEAVVWGLEPDEIEMRFVRDDDECKLEVTALPDNSRPLERGDASFVFVGTYEETCLPFWRALRNLEGRYSPEELARHWQSYFPHRELALLTERLGKN